MIAPRLLLITSLVVTTLVAPIDSQIVKTKIYPSSTEASSSYSRDSEMRKAIVAAAGDSETDDSPHPLLSLVLEFNEQVEMSGEQERSSRGENNASKFPEYEYLPRYNLTETKSNSAIAFSGGGSRAFLCAAGYTAGLRNAGLLSKARYMAGISGGNWFVNSYVYRGSKQNEDVGVYLGEVAAPEDCTMDKLGEMEKLCIR
jgi:hypothetical protein